MQIMEEKTFMGMGNGVTANVGNAARSTSLLPMSLIFGSPSGSVTGRIRFGFLRRPRCKGFWLE